MGQACPDTASSKMSTATDARVEKDQRYRDRQREEIVASLPGLHILPPVNTRAMALALCLATGIPRRDPTCRKGLLVRRRHGQCKPSARVDAGAGILRRFVKPDPCPQQTNDFNVLTSVAQTPILGEGPAYCEDPFDLQVLANLSALISH
jgi:hypothetical protein